MSCIDIDIPEFRPRLGIDVHDDDGELLGHVAIDNFLRGRCCGGIRMAADVSWNEIRGLANAMSLKFAFMNSALGGAKSGILCPADADRAERHRRLALFGRTLGPVLRTVYSCGGDLGVGPDELAVVRRAAGLPASERAGTRRGGYFTAFGVYANVRAWLRRAGIGATFATAVIEGYGSVGRPLARLLHDFGVRILGISTIHGAVFNENGIDLDKLEELQAAHGDECVRHLVNSAHLEPGELLAQPATVLIPGARPWTIRGANADCLECRAVIPAANIPVTPAAGERLEQRGIAVIPDFVSNSGGIFGGSLVNQGFPREVAEQLMMRIYSARLEGLMVRAERTASSLRQTAERVVEENRARLDRRNGSAVASLTEHLRARNGWRRVGRRAALSAFQAGYRWFGDRANHLPVTLRDAAGEAIVDRSITDSLRGPYSGSDHATT